MARIDIEKDNLVVHVEGLDKLRAMRGTISVPLRHVVGIDLHPALNFAFGTSQMSSVRGTYVPGHTYEGNFPTPDGDGRMFCDVHHPERAISIELMEEEFRRLIVEPSNESPAAAKARIEAALP